MTLHHGGFPIRKSTDRSLFAAPRGLSQLVASFFGSWCQGIRPVLLFAWTFLRVPFRKRLLFSELLEFHKQILFGIHIAVKRFFLFMLLESFHLAVKLYLPSFGKTKSSFDANLLKILSSKSVRFYSSICFIRFSMNTAGLLTPFPRPCSLGGRSGWTRTIDLALIRRAL